MQMQMPTVPGPHQYNYIPSVYKLPRVKLKDYGIKNNSEDHSLKLCYCLCLKIGF